MGGAIRAVPEPTLNIELVTLEQDLLYSDRKKDINSYKDNLMNTRRMTTLTIGCALFLLLAASAARADKSYSVTLYNGLVEATGNGGCTCQPVSATCWTQDGSGAKLQTRNPLNGYTPQTLTFKLTDKQGTCTSIDVTATCHYFQTTWTNKGRASQTSHSSWADETTTASLGCQAVQIIITEGTSGNTTYQRLATVCR